MSTGCAYEGWVRHRRLAPVEHSFRYPLLMRYFDVDEPPAGFRRTDHFGEPGRRLRDEVLDLVEERTGRRPDGPVHLLTQLRRLGFSFNPVSFYFCFEPEGRRLDAVAAEVTSTPWRERHVYVLERTGDERVLAGRVDKELHVSPFLDMEGEYALRVSEPGDTLQVHIENRAVGRAQFDATLSLRRRELGPRLLLRHPAGPLGVIARIYLQALLLKLKGLRVHRRPARAR